MLIVPSREQLPSKEKTPSSDSDETQIGPYGHQLIHIIFPTPGSLRLSIFPRCTQGEAAVRRTLLIRPSSTNLFNHQATGHTEPRQLHLPTTEVRGYLGGTGASPF